MSAQSPTLTAVRYDGAGLVALQWDPVEGAINFVTAVFDGDGRIVAQGTGFGVQGSVRVPGPLSGSPYAAAAIKSDSAPVWGTTLPLVLERLTTLTASYAGGTTVDARWSFPAGSFANGATLVALDTTSGDELGQAVVFADGGQLTLTGPLDPAAPSSRYVLQGAATLGGSVGPPISTPLIASPARLRGLRYDPARPQLEAFLDQPVPAGASAGIALYAGGRLVQEAVAPTPGMAVGLRPAAALDLATDWSVRPFWTVQGSRGPSGDPLAVVVEAPRIRTVGWETGSLVITWENAPGPPYPTGAQVEISTPDGRVWCGFVSPDPTGARFVPDPALQPASAYAVTVAALRGGSQGPPSRAAPVVVGKSPLALAAYDGRVVRASWTDSPPIAAREARLRVRAGELLVAEVGAIARHAAVEVALEPGGLYSASLVWVNGPSGSSGPEGPPTALVAGAPLLASATVDSGDVTLAWADAPDDASAITGLQAVFSSPGFAARSAPISRAAPTVAIAAPSQDPFVPVSVALQALGSGAAGPLSDALPLPLAAPAVTRVALGDDGALHVAWTPVAGVVGAYLVSVTRDGAALASATVPADRSGVALPLGAIAPAAAYAVTVVVRAGGARGPLPAAATRALATAPALGAAGFDGTTATIPLTAPAGGGPAPDRYELELLRDGAVVQRATVAPPAAGAPLTLAVAPAVGRDGRFGLAVRAGSGPALGPAATTAVLLSGPPAGLSADFDGLTVLARWTPVAGATGHRVTVVADGHAEPIAHGDAPAGAGELRLAVRLPDTTSAWQLAVQPLLGAGSGPPARVPLFAPGLYLRSDGQPRLFRAASPALAPQALSAYLPQIGPLSGLPLPAAPSDAPLRIVANDDSATSAVFPYRLLIGGAALDFSSGESIRAAVWSASEALLASAEDGGATPWGIVQLQQAISRLLPQTFAETLLYAYGLSPTTGTADLRPGMVLRVVASDFALMPSNRPPAWAQGYAGGAAADYELADYLDVTPRPADAPWLLGFDGYLSWLCANGALTVPAPQSENALQSGAADAADLYWPLFRQPFYRLFAPVELQSATPPAVAQTRQQFTLAAAATHRLISGARAAASPGVAVAYFRGRAVVRLMIRVVVDGETQLVPVGTTVGNLLDRFARRPPRAATALRGLALERSSGPVVLDPSAYAVGGGLPVALGYGGLATFDRRDALSLPLLHGDRLTLGEAAR
jgi:hypothetical protein